MARAESYLCAKFHLDSSNCLATIRQRYRQDRQTDRQTERQRSDSIGRTVLQTVAQKVSGEKLNQRQKELVKPDCARVCGSEQYFVIIALTIVLYDISCQDCNLIGDVCGGGC